MGNAGGAGRPPGPRWVHVLAVLVCLVASLECGRRQAKPDEPERLTIAFQEWVGYGPLYLAADKGFFAEEGLELVFVDEQLDAARREAFKAGMLDVEAATIDLLVTKRAFDTPIVAVSEVDRSLGGDAIVAIEEIHVLNDLVGRKVAFARDDVGETFLSFLFQKAGLSLDQITVVPTRPDQAAQAFLDGRADAAVTWEPWVPRALARPGAHVLLSTKDEPGIIIDVLNVREDVVRQKPGAVRALLRGWYRAIDYLRAHPEEASQSIAPYFGLTAAEYSEHVKGLYWPTREEALSDFGTEGRPGRVYEVFDTVALIKHQNGRIPHRPDAASAIAPEILCTLHESEMNAE